MELNLEINEIVGIIGGGVVEGEYKGKVRGIGSLMEAREGDLTFLGNMKYKGMVEETKASVVLVPVSYEGKAREGQAYIRMENPSMGLAKLCYYLEEKMYPRREEGVHAQASIAKGAKIGKGVYVGPFCVVEEGAKIGDGVVLVANVYVGRNVEIGEGSYLMPHVSVMDYCVLGKRVRLHAGVVIGGDGFGYETVKGVHMKVPQIGNVVVEDDVEIGANATVDRGRFSETRIGGGSKIDNLVMIAHNVKVGKGCLFAAQVGISGSTKVGNYVIAGGQAGFAGHLEVGDGCVIGAQSGVNHSLDAGSNVRGTPISPFMFAQRVEVLKRRLPELFKRVESLEGMNGIVYKRKYQRKTEEHE